MIELKHVSFAYQGQEHDGLHDINLTIADDTQAECFWPWRESEIVAPFNSSPCGTHSLEAWDVYKDGVFLQTEYLVHHTV